MGALAVAGRVQLVEGAGCDAGGRQAQHHPGEHVGHVELTGIGGVGQDHVAAEHRDRQPAQVVRLAQQHLAGPLAVAVAVGVAVVDRPRRADLTDVGVLGELTRCDLVAHPDRRHIRVRLLLAGQRDPQQLGGAQCVGAEKFAVRQHVVDQGRGVDDQVDGVGQPLPGLLVQPKVGLALVAGEHLQVVGGQLLVVGQQLRVPTVKGLVQPGPGLLIRLRPHQGDHLAVDQVHPLQPFQGQVATQEPGRAGQQHGAHLGAGPRQLWRGSQRRCIDELVQREVTGVHLGGAATVHRGETGPLAALLLRLDVVGDGRQVVGRADDHAHRHVDVEDLVQQVAECQRRQRVSAQVGEVRVRVQLGGRRAQQRGGGPGHRLQHRCVGTAAAQFAELVGLPVGQVGVELFEAFAVVLLEFRPRQLADAGQQAVLQRERRCLDDEVARHLIRLQVGLVGHVLQRFGDRRLKPARLSA